MKRPTRKTAPKTRKPAAKRPAAKSRNPSKKPAKRPAAPAKAAGHAPDTVYLFLRAFPSMRALDVLHAGHDGTVAGIREVARRLQHRADAEGYDWSFAASQLIATDGRGRAGWAISPNLAHISRVGTDAAAYTLGDLSRAPAKKALTRR